MRKRRAVCVVLWSTLCALTHLGCSDELSADAQPRSYCDRFALLSTAAPCCDADGDGYGINDDRSQCDFASQDTNDQCSTCHPDAHELCDGLDNDGDEEVDELYPCQNATECPATRYGYDAKWLCLEGLCRLTPYNTPGGCILDLYVCQDGQMLEPEITCPQNQQ